MKFGELIKTMRMVKSMTIRQVAEKSGLAQSYICDLENNKSNPTLTSAKKITSVFGKTLWEVLKIADI